jgi:hypothetical protein
MHTWPILHFVMLLAVGPTVQAPRVRPDWTVIKPTVTTQDELIATFGPPDEVLATFPWTEWNAKWKKRPISRTYTLRYLVVSRSSLLPGPAGSAEAVEVIVGDKRVIAVRWIYHGPTARAAMDAIRNDPEMDFAPRESDFPSASKPLPNGWLVVERLRDGGTVHVTLDLK